MAIRFLCSACDQPIEIDDEWAGKLVACPFCHKTVKAPIDSTIADLDEIPTASPLGDVSGGPMQPGFPPPVAHAVGGNRLAVISLCLACGAILQLVLAGALLSRHELELEMLRERTEALHKEGVSPLAASQQAMLEFYTEAGGAPPRWIIAVGLLYFTLGLTWLATVVCAVIAIRRVPRRGFALAALMIGGVLPVLMCCGGLTFGW